MQNNVTELTDKLLRALDTNYNVTDMQTVINIIVLLDKVAITKEVLEATRLGKHVNELRRNTSSDWLAKRAKELVKKWRNLVLAPLQQQQHQQQSYDHSATTTNNGQMKQQTMSHAPPPVIRDKVIQRQDVAQVLEDIGGGRAPGHGSGSKKRSAKERLDTNSSGVTSKRPRILNGGSELDLSDTSNSSFHDVVLARNELRLAKTSASATSSAILINSDSNSSITEYKSQLQVSTIPPPATISSNSTLTPPLTSPSSTSSLPQPHSNSPALPVTTTATITAATQQPTIPSSNATTTAAQRRRGRRKGSSAHRNLLDEADASFNSKMARGANARVKTTQELVASLSSLGGGGRAVGVVAGGGVTAALAAGGKAGSVSGTTTKEDLVQKAAKLTERVVEIDQKLNTNANRYKNNGGSTLTTTTASNKHHHHHHYRHNNNNIINSLSNNLGTYEGDDEDVIVVDEVEVVARQQERRHRKRRDSAAMKGVEDNVIVKLEQEKEGLDGGGAGGQSLQQPQRSLDTALALSLLPPIDRSFLNSPTHTSQERPNCSCRLVDNSQRHITTTIINTAINKKHSDFSIGGSDDEQDQDEDQHPHQLTEQQPPPYEWEADDDCLAGVYLQKKYRLGGDMDSMVDIVHERYLPGVNCNTQQQVIVTSDVGPSSDNVVPDVYRDLQRKLEAYKPYSISEIDGSDSSVKLETDDKDRTAVSTSEVAGGDNVECREYHEVLDMPSYNGEMLRILPYVIID